MSEPVSIQRLAAQMAGAGACDNCGQLLAAHCAACPVPCCPGTCPVQDEAAGRLLHAIFGEAEIAHTYTPPAHQNSAL